MVYVWVMRVISTTVAVASVLLSAAVLAACGATTVRPGEARGKSGDDLDSRYEAVERLTYPRKSAIGVASHQGSAAVSDPATGRSFAITVDGLTEESGSYIRRFSVHAPARDLLGLARKVATYLTVLWGLTDVRLGRLNSRLRAGAVDVYLCRDGEGGAQSRKSICVFEVASPRSELEWARTLAHELGHFLLPGPSGFAEPESWSNGLFGERLFLGWLRDELAATPDEVSAVPFVNANEVRDYCQKQTDALVARVCARGPDMALLSGTGRRSMDEATALLLYVARVHRPAALQELLMYLPVRTGREPTALDFASAYELWCARTGARTIACVAGAQCIYVPAGHYEVSIQAGRADRIAAEGLTVRKGAGSGWRVAAPRNGWYRLTVSEGGGPAAALPMMAWRRL